MDDAPKCLCAGADTKPVVERMYFLDGHAYDLVKCRRCGLVSVSPKPTPDAVAGLYQNESYFQDDYSCSKGYSIEEAKRHDTAKLDRYRKLVQEITALNNGTGTLLEVGCSSGLFLDAAQERGWSVTGVEVSAFAADHAAPGVREHILVGDLLELNVGAASFDVAYLSHVFEHFLQPPDYLHRLRGLLRPGALLIIEVPNFINSPMYPLVSAAFKTLRGLGMKPGRHLCEFFRIKHPDVPFKPYHLYEFSRRSLTCLLEQYEFRIERVRHVMPSIKRPVPDSLAGRAKLVVYSAIRLAIERLNLPGGDLTVFARR